MRRRLASAALVAGLLASPAHAETRDLLWRVVQACVLNHSLTGTAFPCLAVDVANGAERGYAVVRAPQDKTRIVIVPTVRTPGIEAARLRGSDAPNYFEDAWASRRYVLADLPTTPSRGDLAMAVNSVSGRSQDQLHVHVACIRPDVKRTILAQRRKIRSDRWTTIKVLPSSVHYTARFVPGDDLRGINPFDQATQALHVAPADMDGVTIVILAAQAAPALRVGQLVRQQQAEAATRQRFEQELEVARLIQQNFLPKQLPELTGWQVAAYYRPAREVGGDFYDVIPLPDGRIGFVIGDVTDKGVPAALVMAATRSVLRASAQRMVDPGAVLERVNEHLCPDMPEKMFVTCLYGVLDPATGVFRFANAGHDLPYVKTAEGSEELRARGMPLGLMPGMGYEEKERVLAPGESLLLHSDGVVEAHDADRQMFGFPRLKQAVADYPGGGELIDRVLDDLRGHTGPDAEQEDDITMVTLARAAGGDSALAEAPDTSQLVEFEVPSAPGNERIALERVTSIVGGLGLDDERLQRLGTAVAEATMNAMEHGNEYRADQPAVVRVHTDAQRVRVEVVDQGAAKLAASDHEPEVPDIEAKLAGLQRPRGWGLFLIQNMVDEAHESTQGDEHVLELVMHLTGAGEAGGER